MGLHNPPEQSPIHTPINPLQSHKEANLSWKLALERYAALLLHSQMEHEQSSVAKPLRMLKEGKKEGDSSKVLDKVWDDFTSDDIVTAPELLELGTLGHEGTRQDDEIPRTPACRQMDIEDDPPLQTLLTPDATPIGAFASSNQLPVQSSNQPILRETDIIPFRALPSSNDSTPVPTTPRNKNDNLPEIGVMQHGGIVLGQSAS